MDRRTSNKKNNDHYPIGARDSRGDLIVDAPNPVNPNPRDNADYPEPKPSTSTIKQMPVATPASSNAQSPAINRPPRAPGPALGPYFQFLNTDLNRMLWRGSALIFRHVSFERPKIEFRCQPKLDHDWEILYDNLFDLRVYRINLSIELRSGEGDDEIHWKIDWKDHTSEGLFRIARCNQKWRGGFFSCNGFDASVPEQEKSKLKFGNVWEHLNATHAETPLHLLIWGGDQTYIDYIFEDVPYLQDWVNMPWNEKWTCDFRDDLREQVEQYHFNTYVENWERPEVRNALSSIPSIMMWDDHDIFDGAGSYPTLLHNSPMMSGLFKTAQKLRLLFQHHTTVDKARDHGLFGYQGHSFLCQCGPNLAILASDGRSERDLETVTNPRSWDITFEKLETNLLNVAHLIVVIPVPFSFVRLKLAESCFEYFRKFSTRCRHLDIVKKTNSIFGLPELYDDLLDEWTHEAHLGERNQTLQRFQQIAEKKKIRVTFFSGDVHCCGIGRFKTHDRTEISPIHDSKLMYQVISSAIVNLPPPRMALHIAQMVTTKWYPVEKTEEEIIDFFQQAPETGSGLTHKKLLPNRNWCYFEQADDVDSSAYTVVKTGCFQRMFPSKRSIPAPDVELNSISRLSTNDNKRMIKPSLKIRLWLESEPQHRPGREFAHYDLLIPSLL